MSLLPLVPNWSSGVKVTHEFKTEILTSRDGTEQRRALRSTPRRKISFNSVTNDEGLRELEGLLTKRQSEELLLADIVRGVPLAGALPVSATSVMVERVPSWLVSGAAVVLSHRRQARSLLVLAVSGNTVTFTTPTTLRFPTGSRLSPATPGRLDARTSLSLLTDSVATVPVEFDVTPCSDEADEGSIDNLVFFRGHEVFMMKPNWSQSPTVTYARETERVDYGRGRIAVFDPLAYGHRINQGTYLQRGLAEIEAAGQFFQRMKGQRGEFYQPTWRHDHRIAADVVAGSSSITVAGLSALNYADDTEVVEIVDEDDVPLVDEDGAALVLAETYVRRSIMVRTRAGQIYFRFVDGASISGANVVLGLDMAWPDNLPMSEIEMICWMPLCRFASDTLTVEWLTDAYAQIAIATRTLVDRFSEIPPVLNEGEAYLLEFFGWAYVSGVFTDPLQEAVNVTYPLTGEIP